MRAAHVAACGGHNDGRPAFLERVWARDLLGQPKQRAHTTRRVVALALMLHARWPQLDHAYPGVKVLAAETGVRRETVGRHLAALTKQGWVAILTEPNFRTGTATEYGLRWPEWHEHRGLNPRA
jgi:DNA-binding MarR family transcriptional regulator